MRFVNNCVTQYNAILISCGNITPLNQNASRTCVKHAYFKVVVYATCDSFRDASDVRYSRCCNRARVDVGLISRIKQPYNIRVAHKPITTLRRLLTNK